MAEPLPSPLPEAGDTEARILEAARRVFVRRGTAGARMAEIAEEAGVNQALLHYYFRSKQRLSEAVFRQAAARLFPRLMEVFAADLPLEEKVERVTAYELDFLAQNPYLPGYILAEMQYGPGPLRALIADLPPVPLDALQAQLDGEAEAGRIVPIQAVDFVVNLIGLLVFPFAAAPMLDALLGVRGHSFEALIERRKRELPAFFLRALRP